MLGLRISFSMEVALGRLHTVGCQHFPGLTVALLGNLAAAGGGDGGGSLVNRGGALVIRPSSASSGAESAGKKGRHAGGRSLRSWQRLGAAPLVATRRQPRA